MGQDDGDRPTGHGEGGGWRCVESDTSLSQQARSLETHSPRRGNEYTLARVQRLQIGATSATTTDLTICLKNST